MNQKFHIFPHNNVILKNADILIEKFWDSFHAARTVKPTDLKIFLNERLKRYVEYMLHTTVLDIGCGKGDNIPYLSQLFKNIHGCDLSKNVLLAAKNNFPSATFKKSTLTNLPYPEGFFDCVCLVKTISVTFDAYYVAALITQIERVLNKNGFLFIVDFCYDEKFENRYERISVPYNTEYVEYNFYKPDWSDVHFIHFKPESLLAVVGTNFQLLEMEDIMLKSVNDNDSSGKIYLFQKNISLKLSL